jgi:dienelactone hydrolase
MKTLPKRLAGGSDSGAGVLEAEIMKPTNLLLLILLVGLLLTIPPNLSAQPVPHHFDGIAALPDRTITLSLGGSVSNMFSLSGTISSQFMQMFDLYAVEASTNLAEWTRLALLLRTNNNPHPLLFQDTNAAGLGERFYRTFTNHLLTAFPKPSGPFAVGMVDRVMIDPARTNLYRYTPATNAFMVTFWYPADPPAAGVLPAAMWDQRIAADTSLYSYAGFDSRWAQIAPKLVGHRFRGVPLATGTNKHPVVLYSHGLPAFRKLVSRTAEELASHGYVVVAIDHADCWATEFPDGRYLTDNHSGDVPGRLKDMTFLLDELAVLNTGDPLFAGRLDLDRIGVTGVSYGGMVVETCRSDSRVKCAVLLDATNVQLNPAGLQKPFLVALGESNAYYSEDQWLFSKAIANAVFLQIRGADHGTLSDVAWTGEIPWGRGPALAIDACYVWFFGTYLKGEAPPFPTNPEIYNVQRK